MVTWLGVHKIITMNKTLFTTAALSSALLGSAIAGSDVDALDASLISKEKNFLDRFTFGTYGEIHARVGDGDDNIDPHRIVLFTNFEISDKLKFVSEIELEHFLTKTEGSDWTSQKLEFKVEQAYLEYDFNENLSGYAGLALVPVGVLNQTHEPTTFYGVERPNVEKYIVPTTWTELGVGVAKTYDNGLQLDAVFHSGLDMKNSDGYIRGGRSNYQFEEFESNTDSWAVTTRAKYTGIAGVELAGSLQYQYDTSSRVAGQQDAILASTHGIYRNGGFQFIALANYWNVDGYSNKDTQDQWGYYLEPSYAWDTAIGKVGVFGRFSQYEYFAESTQKRKELNAGVNYWINEHLVVKTDYTNIDNDGIANDETVNFGFGWHY